MKEVNYQSLSQELDEILAELSAADLDIDKAVTKYERGMAIVKQLENYLEKAENKVKKIKSSLDTK